jgi:hypothetical protein
MAGPGEWEQESWSSRPDAPRGLSGATVATLVVGWVTLGISVIFTILGLGAARHFAGIFLVLLILSALLSVAGLVGLSRRRRWGWIILVCLSGLGLVFDVMALAQGTLRLSTNLLLLILLFLPGTRGDLEG